jgi:hypothetical protein
MSVVGDLHVDPFWVEDYKLKLAYRSSHSDRMWTRFNYFPTIEAALIAFFVVVSTKGLERRGRWAALVEIILSLAWLVVGSRDRYLWKRADKSVALAAERVMKDHAELEDYKYVGYLTEGPDSLKEGTDHTAPDGVLAVWYSIRGLHQSRASVTTTALNLPFAATLLWGIVFGVLFFQSESWPHAFIGGIVGCLLTALAICVLGMAITIARPGPE